MSSFVGSKNGEGVYQRIINWMPPHEVYIEPFTGTAAVFRHKRPAPQRSILIDLDPGALNIDPDPRAFDRFRPDDLVTRSEVGVPEVIVGDGVEFIRRFLWAPPSDVLIYADPPYLRETRRDRDYYASEWTREDHERFLNVVTSPGMTYRVLISGYRSDLYAEKLAGWHTDHFTVSTRGGPAEEWLWANYPRPTELHDYRYIGAGYKERWRIHKRQNSWCGMLKGMDPVERRAMLAKLMEEFAQELPRINYYPVRSRLARIREDLTDDDVGARGSTIPSM